MICWRRDWLPTPVFLGFPCVLAGKESTCNERDLGSIPGLGRPPWTRERLLTPVFWPGEFYRLYSSWGHKELDTTEQTFTFIHIPWASQVALVAKSPPINPGEEADVGLVLGKIPWRRAWQPTAVFLPVGSQRSLVGYSPWGCRAGHISMHTRVHTA